MRVPALYPIVDLDFDLDLDDDLGIDARRVDGHQTSAYEEDDFEAKSDVFDVITRDELLGRDEYLEVAGFDHDLALFGQTVDALRAGQLMTANLQVRYLDEQWPVVDFIHDEDEFEEEFPDDGESRDEIATDESPDPWERLCAPLDEPDDEVVSSFGHTLH